MRVLQKMSQITELNGYIPANSIINAIVLAFATTFFLYFVIGTYFFIKIKIEEYKEEFKKNGKN